MPPTPQSQPGVALDGVIYEMVPHGAWMRVTAMHEPTLTEVVVHGPARAGAEALQKLAHDRLVWVLGRQGRPHP